MRRGITLLILFFTIIITASSKYGLFVSGKQEIPEEAIRLRIVANSNDDIDQELKLQIKDEVIEYITPIIEDIDDHEEARKELYENVDGISQVVNTVLKENNKETNYYVDYGLTNFPTKTYGDKVYKAGKYEAIYIVLGEGKGDNFWCVLFPPLCLVDVTLEDDQITSTEDVEYSFYIADKIKSLFRNNK